MDHDFWHQRWEQGQIGFHEGEANQHLMSHSAHLGFGKRVLVPLCGKAVDLTYLAAFGHQVVGVELVESAVKDFFATLGASPTVTKEGAHVRYTAKNLTIFAGDFFTTTRELLGPVDALYDRAALIALPEPMRRDYVKHLRALLPKGAPGLCITLEYDQAKMSGPPFNVPEAELRALYEGATVALLDEVEASGSPRIREAGAKEKAFALTF